MLKMQGGKTTFFASFTLWKANRLLNLVDILRSKNGFRHRVSTMLQALKNSFVAAR